MMDSQMIFLPGSFSLGWASRCLITKEEKSREGDGGASQAGPPPFWDTAVVTPDPQQPWEAVPLPQEGLVSIPNHSMIGELP